jgi:hypothetical protein
MPQQQLLSAEQGACNQISFSGQSIALHRYPSQIASSPLPSSPTQLLPTQHYETPIRPNAPHQKPPDTEPAFQSQFTLGLVEEWFP